MDYYYPYLFVFMNYQSECAPSFQNKWDISGIFLFWRVWVQAIISRYRIPDDFPRYHASPSFKLFLRGAGMVFSFVILPANHIGFSLCCGNLQKTVHLSNTTFQEKPPHSLLEKNVVESLVRRGLRHSQKAHFCRASLSIPTGFGKKGQTVPEVYNN